MGIICFQKTGRLKVVSNKPNRFTPARESFLLNSFTYDPSYDIKPGFFYFDLPNYGQIQYILRKSSAEQGNQQLAETLQLHLRQIDMAIEQFESGTPQNIQKQNASKEIHQEKQKEQKVEKFLQDYQVYQYNHKSEEISLKSEGSQKQSNRKGLDNVLNFQLVGVTLNDYEDMEDLPFQIYLNNKKLITVMGSIYQSKWRPTSPNQISVINFSAIFLNLKNQSHIKIISHIQQEQVECTIPINPMTFKYLIPILQTSNIRTKQDNEPSGHVHFKIQYIDNYEEHKAKVLKDLFVRKQGLKEILSRIKIKDQSVPLDKTIEIIQPNNNQSYRSDIIEQK